MTRARAIHTTESLLARTVEEGDCRLWTGFATNRTPLVCEDGRMVPVRRVLSRLAGRDDGAAYYAAACGNPLCVEQEHTVARTHKQHMRVMGKTASTGAGAAARRARITAARRARGDVVPDDVVQAILASNESGPVLAARYGISRSTVNNYRSARIGRTAGNNPFAALIRRAA